ncbi:GAF domain-containing protein [Rhodobacteraceae bacterium]|nr:GAF domain-containing protein [Paracoccaceae bacterium]
MTVSHSAHLGHEAARAPSTVDLTDCDREPIQHLGRVQSWGGLIAVNADWIVRQYSVNAPKMLGLEFDDLQGRLLTDLLPHAAHKLIRHQMASLENFDQNLRLFGLQLSADGGLFDVAAHRTPDGFILEFEPKRTGRHVSDLSLVQPMIQRLAQENDIGVMSEIAAENLRRLTGFARVMVYKFADDGTGQVIAEALAPSMSGYKGLRFPASDIPAQARALYKRSLLRLIGNVDDPGAAITPALNADGKPLDLSLAVTRAVSPVHLQYLRNMGVQASMSVSILNKGELWGLLACHHPEPLLMDYERRTAVELFGQLFAYELARTETAQENEAVLRGQDTHNRIMSLISSSSSWEENFDTIANIVQQRMPYDGIAIFSDGHYMSRGSAPSETEFHELARFLNTATGSRVYCTHHLGAVFPPASAFVDRVAGLLALPISRRPRDYLVLFRRELAQTVTWAGDPTKPVNTSGPNTQLSPRNSFSLWRQVVQGESQPWSLSEQRAAEALRTTLLEVVLKLTDQAEKDRKQAQERQALLISELNHRVRNILNLIRSIMKQSSHDAMSLEDFTQALDGRINALSRAHDQLTQEQYAPVALSDLIGVEATAFGLSDQARLVFEGNDIVITPEAFTPLALVFHELVTNSVKYGAFSSSNGRVHIAIHEAQDGSYVIGWTERGGPVVKAPKRRGFGSTVIERTIPHEMHGSAEVHYHSAGLEAAFTVPSNAVVRTQPFAAAADPLQAVKTTPPRVGVGIAHVDGPVLVLEDTMIVALDLAGMLEDLGSSDVRTCATVDEAFEILQSGFTPALAVLDVNLGGETSLPVAEHLAGLNVPFLLASGYDRNEAGIESYPPSELLRKPYTSSDLASTLCSLGFVQGA